MLKRERPATIFLLKGQTKNSQVMQNSRLIRLAKFTHQLKSNLTLNSDQNSVKYYRSLHSCCVLRISKLKIPEENCISIKLFTNLKTQSYCIQRWPNFNLYIPNSTLKSQAHDYHTPSKSLSFSLPINFVFIKSQLILSLTKTVNQVQNFLILIQLNQVIRLGGQNNTKAFKTALFLNQGYVFLMTYQTDQQIQSKAIRFIFLQNILQKTFQAKMQLGKDALQAKKPTKRRYFYVLKKNFRDQVLLNLFSSQEYQAMCQHSWLKSLLHKCQTFILKIINGLGILLIALGFNQEYQKFYNSLMMTKLFSLLVLGCLLFLASATVYDAVMTCGTCTAAKTGCTGNKCVFLTGGLTAEYCYGKDTCGFTTSQNIKLGSCSKDLTNTDCASGVCMAGVTKDTCFSPIGGTCPVGGVFTQACVLGTVYSGITTGGSSQNTTTSLGSCPFLATGGTYASCTSDVYGSTCSCCATFTMTGLSSTGSMLGACLPSSSPLVGIKASLGGQMMALLSGLLFFVMAFVY